MASLKRVLTKVTFAGEATCTDLEEKEKEGEVVGGGAEGEEVAETVSLFTISTSKRRTMACRLAVNKSIVPIFTVVEYNKDVMDVLFLYFSKKNHTLRKKKKCTVVFLQICILRTNLFIGTF